MNETSTETAREIGIREAAGEYHINLEIFEGPFDLLLYLIRKHDIEIRDIPIALLTEEYLRYLDTMQELDIDLAGEFVLMASDLMHIKSHMLLPVAPVLDEEDGVDPRASLVQRLMEYQRFKDASVQLTEQPMRDRDVYLRQGEGDEGLEPVEAPLAELNVFDLIGAFDKVLKRMPVENYHTVAVDRIGVSECIYGLMERLELNRPMALEMLLPEKLTKYDIVINFLSLLEMAKLNMITLFQGGVDESIYITRVMEEQTVGVDLHSTVTYA